MNTTSIAWIFGILWLLESIDVIKQRLLKVTKAKDKEKVIVLLQTLIEVLVPESPHMIIELHEEIR